MSDAFRHGVMDQRYKSSEDYRNAMSNADSSPKNNYVVTPDNIIN